MVVGVGVVVVYFLGGSANLTCLSFSDVERPMLFMLSRRPSKLKLACGRTPVVLDDLDFLLVFAVSVRIQETVCSFSCCLSRLEVFRSFRRLWYNRTKCCSFSVRSMGSFVSRRSTNSRMRSCRPFLPSPADTTPRLRIMHFHKKRSSLGVRSSSGLSWIHFVYSTMELSGSCQRR